MGARILLATLWLLHWLPLTVQAALGRALGALLFMVVHTRRRIALRNLELCFAEMSNAEREQLARDLGIRTISFVRRVDLFEELKALGADQVFPDDESGLTSAREILSGANAALAFNAVGGESALRLIKLLREGGSHITYGAMGKKPLTVPNGMLIFRDIQLRGLWVSRWIENAPTEEVRNVYENLATRVVAGKIVQTVDSTYPLESFQKALARLEAPERSGKVLFLP